MICPYYKNKEVFDGFNEMIEAFGGKPMTEEEFRSADLRNERTGRDFAAMEAAYTVYDKNGGNFLDMTPTGKPSILFQTLLDYFGGDKTKAIVAKSNIYSNEFINWFGDWTSNANDFNLDNIDYSLVDIEEHTKHWKDNPEKSNRAIRIYLKDQHEKGFFELVKDHEDGYFSIHFKTTKEGAKYNSTTTEPSSKEDRKILFQQLVNAIPNGAKISTWGSLSEDGIRGIDNVGRNMHKVGERSALLKSDGSEIKIPIYQKGHNVSKVVDENGEPKVMLRTDGAGKAIMGRGDGGAFFATDNLLVAGSYASDEADLYKGFVNLKNPYIVKGESHGFFFEYKGEETTVQKAQPSLTQDGYDGVYFERTWDVGDYADVEPGDNYWANNVAMFNPNQFKSATNNNGQFSTKNVDIHMLITRTVQNGQQFENAAISDFGTDIMSRLLNGESVISGEVVEQLLSSESLSFDNMRIAEILKRHNIPLVLNGSIGTFTLASTETDKNTGRSIILLNPNLINQVTKGYLGEAILHEIIHAVTVNAINKPSNEIEQEFVNLNKKVFNVMSKAFPKYSSLFNNVELGLYALNNEKEFAAVFITDDEARNAFYHIAKQIDIQKDGKFVNTFKRFMNSILHLFVNKNVFNTNYETLKKYQASFLKHLIGIPTQKTQKISSKTLQELYDNIDPVAMETESIIDKMSYIQTYADAVERNNIITLSLSAEGKNKDTTYSFDDIVQKLQIRVNALKTSDLKQSEKNKYINDTRTQIDMFVNQQTAKYVAITSTLRQVIPQVLYDVRRLKNINLNTDQSLSGTEYMYQMHSNIAMYQDIAETMLGLLDQQSSSQQIIEEYNKNVPEDKKITIQDLEEVKESVQDLAQITKEGVAILKILRDRTAKDILRKKAQKEGILENMDEYLNTITENPTFDDNISSFELWMGSMDSASNEALRALSGIVNRALKKADTAVINKTTKLLELQAALKMNESVVDLYETDDNGLTTQYLIRKLNYGKFYKAYDNELIRINRLFNDVFNNINGYKIIEEDSRVAPQDSVGEIELNASQKSKLGLNMSENYTIQQAWNELKNKWLDENCERKYNKRYYDAWNKVPQVAKDALDSINSEISSILSQPGVLGEDGYNHYDVLSDEDWNTLQDLWVQKKILRSDYDMFGNLKQEGSTEYKIAKALQQLNKDLYGDSKQKIKKDKASWESAMKNEIIACGGISSYNKWKSGEKNHGFDVKRFKKWHMRNSRLEFKKDAEGNAIIFQDIENAMQGMVVDYGQEYNDLKIQADELLKPYRSQNGEVNASQLPNAVKNLLNEIYSKQYDIRKEVLSNNPALKAASKKYKEVFDQFIKFEDTEYYKQIKREIKKAAIQEDGTFNFDLYDALLETYGHFIIDTGTGIETGFKPYRWLQRMEAIDTEKYMEYQPGEAWTEKVDNEDLLNSKFDPNEGVSFIPKKSKYDNSKKFSKIENSKTLKALYDEVVKTMQESNAMQQNRTYADDFLLPSITGSIWKRMKRHSAWGKTKVLFKYLAESIGIGYNPNDFSQIGSNMALDVIDSEGNTTINQTPIQGEYPDGRTFHILPQYYTRKMDDASQISSDLVNIVTNYYKMSSYYAERVAIKDDCETIVDFLEQRKTKSTKTHFKKGKNKDKSRLFNAAEKFLEMNLYDIRRSSTTFNIGPIELQWSKTVSLWKTWTTRRNLGLNPKVALTGFLTTLGTHILNTITGQHYGHEGYVAFLEVIRRIGQNFIGARYIGNPLSNDDMMVMAEVFDIAGQAERKYEGTHRNRFVQAAYKNSIFGFLSTVDFITKAIIMVSILMNHHYVNGKFLSREDIRNSRYLYSSKKEFNDAMKEWKKGPNLYKLLKAKNHRLTIEDKYKSAFQDAFDVIKDRVQKTSEYADGMATDLQRAAITQSVLGALVLIHKQYLPLIIQRYFGKRVYDYDTHQYKNGVFRTLFDFVGQIMQNNLLAGIGAGIFTGSAFGGVIGGAIGGISAFGVRAYGSYQHRHGKQKKSIKQIFNDEFNDFSSRKATMHSYANRYSIKDVAATVIGYRLLVQPLVGLVCSIADEDDDDTWWLQLLAYSLRAFEWEYYTAFRTDDMLNNVKSPTAATSVVDAAESLAGSITNTIAPQGNFLFDPSQTWDDWENIFGGKDYEIQKGVYEGWQPWQRDIVKGMAVHNLIEQLKNAKAKRKYQENQIMRIKKPETSE